ncbi:hypothetical protein F5884DRAFT_381226 [Xylogone sp. PMI_703]|nr:hypothetical protein F5884DRAFT_381226 [Xylogone sp. PMI_703]
MMATEATSENLAARNSKSENELNTPAETSNHNAPPDVPSINGLSKSDENKQDAETIEAAITSAEVSVSGGSDTETSKTETSKGVGDEKGHTRTTSTLKKHSSFKPVSVNKTFLAAKGVIPTVPSKLGDKTGTISPAAQTGPSITASTRPRLVAKTGSGLRDSSPRSGSGANGSKAGAAPDANAVWNKNRPAPPPEPKRFTDEELKQRYGIHLATRLQSDDPGKQANWADIDDDDDDWAPETIEWTDGTKITLPHTDETVAPSPKPAAANIVKETKIEVPKPKSPAPQPSPSPTIKTGTFGSGRAGLVLKGASEKPTLVAKPPGPPTPVKSPWATLPPIEKVPPIAVEIAAQTQQQNQNRTPQRDSHGGSGMPHPQTKEIAADDFSRSWRDTSAHSSRELYNSQSGKYEPVNDSRRGSSRNEARQPAVLQRSQDHQGPAEPSAAFQTHRVGGQDAVYGRRRTSSNVSGGSGNFVRRMSKGHDMPPPTELLSARRGSLAAVSDAPSSPRNFSPSGQPSSRNHQNQQWQSRASPVFSHPSPRLAHGQIVPPGMDSTEASAPNEPMEDPIELQKRLMRQARELAIKRRQEEEAKEEAERRERIRIKLEAMGPPPETKKNKKEALKEDKQTANQAHVPESGEASKVQPKPPSTEATHETAAKTAASINELTSSMKSLNAKKTESINQSEEKRPNGVDQNVGSSTTTATSHQPLQEGRSSQTWQDNTPNPDRFSNWTSPQTQRNVWGPPSNDKSLGNGTFNADLSRLPDMHQAPPPGSIAPLYSGRGNDQYLGRSREPYGSRPAPIAPPSRQSAMTREEQQQRSRATAAWGNLPEKLAKEEAALAQQQEQELARRRELHESGFDAPRPIYKDTWRQVTVSEDGTRRTQGVSTTTLTNPPLNDSSTTGSSTWKAYTDNSVDESRQEPSQPQFNDTWRSASNINTSAVRGSRFFPNKDVRLEEQAALFDRPGSPSPPPPTMDGHPAYDGDVAHPHVSLPRPPPVVKLPPTVLAPIGPPRPTSFASAAASSLSKITSGTSPSGHQESSHRHHEVRRPPEHGTGIWQERIDSLMGRKTTTAKSHVLAVDSSSKSALEVPKSPLAATVSLPSQTAETDSNGYLVVTKPAAEECFEEQEMGSTPIVRVPKDHPLHPLEMVMSQPKNLPRRFLVSQVTGSEEVSFPQETDHNSIIISIKLPTQDTAKKVQLPIPRQKSNPRRHNNKGGSNRHTSSTHPRGGKGRDGSSSFNSPKADGQSVSPSPSQSARGSNRGRGGYGNSQWSRHVPTPVHT